MTATLQQICPTCGQTIREQRSADQYTLEGKAIEGVLDMTSGLYGMQYETKMIASVNVDLSRFRKVTVRADFTKLPFKDESFDWALFDPPHTVDTRNTLLGTLAPRAGMGPHLAAFKYGCYRNITQLRKGVEAGAIEAYRILKTGGQLIFKWSDSEKPFSWATDTVEKANPGFTKERLAILKSRAHSGNATFYVWYKKK